MTVSASDVRVGKCYVIPTVPADNPPIVIAGLDPAIHSAGISIGWCGGMDARLKAGHDGRESISNAAGMTGLSEVRRVVEADISEVTYEPLGQQTKPGSAAHVSISREKFAAEVDREVACPE